MVQISNILKKRPWTAHTLYPEYRKTLKNIYTPPFVVRPGTAAGG
jgi:hypothetical protein